jgi:hypothetical protein
MKATTLFFIFFSMSFFYGQEILVINISESFDGYNLQYLDRHIFIQNTQNVDISGEIIGQMVTIKPNSTEGITIKPINFTNALPMPFSGGNGTTKIGTGSDINSGHSLPKNYIITPLTKEILLVNHGQDRVLEKGSIYNSTGQMLKQINFDYSSTFDVSNLPIGVYFLVATDQNNHIIKLTFIKQNN